MKTSSSRAFTLIEMLVVMVVIAILAGLIVAVQGFVQKKAALLRADGEIHGMMTAAENYKADFGAHPREVTITDELDPRKDGNPTDAKYLSASLYFYKLLSGDAVAGTSAPATQADILAGKPDGKAETKPYFEFRPDMLRKNSTNTEIRFIQDPFNNCYGYSTAGVAYEEKFRTDLQKDPNSSRSDPKGFNPTFDLWSTGGVIPSSATGGGSQLNEQRKRWVKNW